MSQGRTTIKLSDDVRYLGVVLDKRLTGNKHVDWKTQKAAVFLMICKPIFGRKCVIGLY